MTEQEAVKVLKRLVLCGICTTGPCEDCERKQAKDAALSALEEIQKYREIGTVEEIRRMQKYASLAKKHGTIGQAIDSCAEYEEIGTVEECRETMERQRSKKVVAGADFIIGYDDDGEPIWETDYTCPECGCGVAGEYVCCPYCRQALDWSK